MAHPDLPTPLLPVYIRTSTFILSSFLELDDVNHMIYEEDSICVQHSPLLRHGLCAV